MPRKKINENEEYVKYLSYLIINNEVNSFQFRDEFDLPANLSRSKIKQLCNKPYNLIIEKPSNESSIHGKHYSYIINFEGFTNYMLNLMKKDTEPFKKWAKTQIFHTQIKTMNYTEDLQRFIKYFLELYLIKDEKGFNLTDDSTTINKVLRDIINFIALKSISGKSHNIKEIKEFMILCEQYYKIIEHNPLIDNIKIF